MSLGRAVRRPPARIGAVLVLTMLLTGCGGPGERVFRDARDGLCFTPPAGWSERALPPSASPRTHERMLVRYRRLQAGRPAWLDVSAVAIPAAAPLERWLAHRVASGPTSERSAIEHIEVRGRTGARIRCAIHVGRRQLCAEMTAIRLGERAYLFTGVFPRDDEAMHEIRRAVASADWSEAVALAPR